VIVGYHAHMDINYDEFNRIFESRQAGYQRLAAEVDFILREKLEKLDIKIHSIRTRVKERHSLLEKIERKDYADPFDEVEDIVGSRIVCLFMPDLIKIEEVIEKEFEVSRTENSIDGRDRDRTAFGYMSNHYICRLPSKHTGPRYDSVKDLKFEIQCRTILMDAWASVSHHLHYKGDVSIPEHLRRDFYALSGLFYVADKHFELYYDEAAASRQAAMSRASFEVLPEDAPLDLDTVQVLLIMLYPDRERPTPRIVSEFVEELATASYETIGALRRELERAAAAALALEEDYKSRIRDGRYTNVGFARQALALADPAFSDHYDATGRSKPWNNYRSLLNKTGSSEHAVRTPPDLPGTP
jgi:putative GTP pyrophosphokinase